MDLVAEEPAGPVVFDQPAYRKADSAASPDTRSQATKSRLRRSGLGISVPFWIGVSRIGVGVVIAHLVIVLLPQSRQHLIGATLSNGTWLGAFDRWDSAYYLGIAQHGYPLADPQHTAFFPGYPLLITAVHGITIGSLGYLQSAIIVSWIAFVAASVLLYRLATKLFGQRVGIIATVLFCWFPASLFFMSPYSESLFALQILIVVSLVERRRFLSAALVAAYASATSPESVALSITLMVAVVLAGKCLVRAILYGALSGAGIAGYALFLWDRFGHPFEFISVEKYWKRTELFPFVGLYRNVLALRHFFVGAGPAPGGSTPTYANVKWIWLLDDASLVLAAALVMALGALWLYRSRARSGERPSALSGDGKEIAPIPVSLIIVSAVIVLLAACTTISPYALPQWASSEGEARFVGIAFPLYISGALIVRRHAALICLVIAGSVGLAILFQALFNLGYWVT